MGGGGGEALGNTVCVLYEKKTVAFLKTVMFFSRKNQVDNRVFSLAPSYYLHPCSDMHFIPFIESQYIFSPYSFQCQALRFKKSIS